jgi:predicted permease
MDLIRTLFSRGVALFKRHELDADLDEELRAHIDLAVEEKMKSGMGPEEARTAALQEFGGVAQTKENYRLRRGLPFVETLALDVRFAARQLRKSPGFAFTTILTLALGIGANAAIFSVVNGVLLKPFAFDDPGRLVILRETVRELAAQAPTLPDNAKHYLNLKAQSKTLENAAIFQLRGFSVAVGDDHPQIVNGLEVAPSFFSVLHSRPVLGRAFLPEEATNGHASVVILSWNAWQRYFQGDANVIGRKFHIDGGESTVVGVLAKTFSFPSIDMIPSSREISTSPLELFTPMIIDMQRLTDRGGFNYLVVGRIRPGVSLSQAQSELQGLQESYTAAMHLPDHLGIAVIPLTKEVTGKVSDGLWLLLAGIGLVLLIGCVNLANLQLARAVSREREASIRSALGAGRGRLLQLALVESLLLAVVGGAFGIGIAVAGVRIFVAAAPAGIPRIHEVEVSFPVLVFTAALSIVTALLFGILPALRSMRADPQAAIQNNSTRVANTRQGSHMRDVLVGSEVAFTLALLVITALVVRSFVRLMTQQRNFASDHVTLVEVNLFNSNYGQSKPNYRTAQIAFLDRGLEGMTQIPGVTAAAVTSQMPLAGESWIDGLVRPDRPMPAGQNPMVNVRMISPDYRAVLEIPLLAGRDLAAADRSHPGSALISGQTARTVWPGEDAIGKTFQLDGETRSVIGVIADARLNDLKKTASMVYIPYWENPRWRLYFFVRSSLSTASLADSIRGVIWKIDPQVAIPTLKPFDDQVNDSIGTERFQTILLASFGVVALALALLGVYGVLTYSVSLRHQEFGIRIALGSNRASLILMVLRQAAYPVLGGIVVGLGGAFVATRWIRSVLYDTQPGDPLAIAASISLLLIIAALAAMIPARRAASIDPMRALRTE